MNKQKIKSKTTQLRNPTTIQPEQSDQSMSAMTDVVFLLLIFFIVTMSSYVEMTLLETNLPTSGSATSVQVVLQNSLKIELSATEEYFVNGVGQSREALNRLLGRYARLMPDAEFLLQCDTESKHHMLVSLLADFAKHKLKNVKLLK
ncbi:MAG: biopolymer transporter ExbD [Victivallaceae bacterium]|nr:biopolymer transporter ExbD [Victivallaceae bacterium]